MGALHTVNGPPAAVSDDIEPVVHERRDRLITGIVTVPPILSLFFVGWQLGRVCWAGATSLCSYCSTCLPVSA